MPEVTDLVQITGLRDLQAQLKAFDGESQKRLRVVLNEAAPLVVDAAQPLTPHKSGRARASIKAMSGQRDAKVQAGSARAPYFGFLDYGNVVGGGQGAVGREDSNPRVFEPGGRIIYPAFRKVQPEVVERLNEGLTLLIAEMGWVATDGG